MKEEFFPLSQNLQNDLLLYSAGSDIFVRSLWLAMVSFEVQYFHEVKSNLSSVSPIIQKYRVKI